MVGLELNDRESLYIADGIEALLKALLALKQAPVKTAAEVEAAAVTAAAKPNIQDRLREKVSECAGEMEGLYDDFRVGGCKLTADFKPMSLMRGMNIAPQMVSDIATIWKNHQAELETALKGKDAQLVEGYSHLGRNELKNMVKFCEAVVNDCGAYVQIKKVERKPRKKKAVPPEKQAARTQAHVRTRTPFGKLRRSLDVSYQEAQVDPRGSRQPCGYLYCEEQRHHWV